MAVKRDLAELINEAPGQGEKSEVASSSSGTVVGEADTWSEGQGGDAGEVILLLPY